MDRKNRLSDRRPGKLTWTSLVRIQAMARSYRDYLQGDYFLIPEEYLSNRMKSFLKRHGEYNG